MLYEGNEVKGKLAMKISTNRARSLSDLGNRSDMYRMYGSRTPTVGALGDTGAVTEIYPKSD